MLKARTETLIVELENKLFGMSHLSDSEFPYTVSAAGNGNYFPIEKLKASDEEVIEIELSEFFRKLVKDHSWMTKEERKRSWKYRDLQEYLLSNFKSVKVVKMGSVFIDVHLIAETNEGDTIIISTMELLIPVYQKVDC